MIEQVVLSVLCDSFSFSRLLLQRAWEVQFSLVCPPCRRVCFVCCSRLKCCPVSDTRRPSMTHPAVELWVSSTKCVCVCVYVWPELSHHVFVYVTAGRKTQSLNTITWQLWNKCVLCGRVARFWEIGNRFCAFGCQQCPCYKAFMSHFHF